MKASNMKVSITPEGRSEGIIRRLGVVLEGSTLRMCKLICWHDCPECFKNTEVILGIAHGEAKGEEIDIKLLETLQSLLTDEINLVKSKAQVP